MILVATNSYGQLDIAGGNDNVIRKNNSTDDTLLLYEYKYYFDPLYNAILRNISFLSCWDEDVVSCYCFWVQEKNMDNNSKIISYYNKDTIIIASGYMVKGKPHGVFKIYCPSFPYCDINEIQDYSIADIIYFKGRILAVYFYNKNEISVRKKSIAFGRRTRTVIVGNISDQKARKFFRKNDDLIKNKLSIK